MNVVLRAQDAYQNQAKTVRTSRDAEYHAFARITSAIRSAAMRGKAGFPELAVALHDNRKLWATLVADVADPSNPLPKDLRVRIIYLAEFTRKYSSQILSKGASPAPLIEINSAVMQGLRTPGKTS